MYLLAKKMFVFISKNEHVYDQNEHVYKQNLQDVRSIYCYE